MRIAVVTEGSTKAHNAEVLKALDGMGHEVFNLGMRNAPGELDLTYMETALIAALALNLGSVDFVVGGCGTGQGFMNAVLQYPGVSCGLLMDDVEAWLFSQVNAGNCVSLQLNKGFGKVDGELKVRFILEKLFNDTAGRGYPPERGEIQRGARARLADLSRLAHYPMDEILARIDPALAEKALAVPGVMELFSQAPESKLKAAVLELGGRNG